MHPERSLRRALLVVPVVILAGVGGTLAADETAPATSKGISIREDHRARETLYQPPYDTWTLYDFRMYPMLRRTENGRRALLLYAGTQNERHLGLKSLQVEIDGTPSVPVLLKHLEIKVDSNGCRTLESVLLEGQDELIRKIAAAREVNVTVVSIRETKRFPLSADEIAGFARIVGLADAPSLPEPEKPTWEAESDQPKNSVINPQIIRSTRVEPEFPAMARERMARGKVTLAAVVRKDGSVEVMDVLKSSARYCGFEQAAIDAVRRWRYVPGQKDGKPVDVYFTMDIDFLWR